jgi:hypothetical protein
MIDHPSQPQHRPDQSNQPPDLQEWVVKYNGYWNIPWDQWDRANAEYQARRRETKP